MSNQAGIALDRAKKLAPLGLKQGKRNCNVPALLPQSLSRLCSLESTMATANIIHAIRQSNEGYHIAPEARKSGLTAIEARIRELGLDTASPKVVIQGSDKRNQKLGTDSAEISTIGRYEGIWSQMLDFCIELGDYDSAIILARDLCPKNPWSVSASTAISFMRFRVLQEGTPLVHHETGAPVTNAKGEQFKCRGDWTSVSTVQLISSGLSKLHAHYKTTTGDYSEACDACRRVPLEAAVKGTTCPDHIGKSHYYRRGCPTKDSTYKDKHKQMMKHVKDVYDSRATFAFLPHQLRDILDYCVATNSNYYLMIWTILIVGVKQFLRIEEDLAIEMERFQQDYFVVTESNVDALAMWVFGKNENEKITLVAWDDEECPEFSPVRAILLWIRVSGITGGKLFPCKEQLLARCTHPTVAIAYDDILDELKHLVTNVLGLDMTNPKMKRFIIGTHMLKKTAHLLAFWGFNRNYGTTQMTPMDEANVQQSARHSNKSRQTSTYLSDAGTLMLLCKKLHPDDPRHKVGEFQSIRIETHPQYEALNLKSKPYAKPLVELAKWYVHEKLGIATEVLPGMSIPQLWRMAMDFTPDLSCEQNYLEALKQHLPPAVYKATVADINKSTESRVSLALSRYAEVNNLATNASVAHALLPVGLHLATPSPSSGSNKRRKHDQDEIVVCKRDWKQEAAKRNLPKAKLLDICEKAIEEIVAEKEKAKILTDPLKTWAYRAAKVLDCLKSCHADDKTAFLEAHPNFTISKFTCSNTKHSGSIP